MTDHFYQVLREQLGKKFQLVDEAGPGVMGFQAALTDAENVMNGWGTQTTARLYPWTPGAATSS